MQKFDNVQRDSIRRSEAYLLRKQQQHANQQEKLFGTIALLACIAGVLYFLYA
jgi:hypothetical protein